MPFSRLFRSRWAALFWAGGVLWTAWDVAGGQPDQAPAANGNVAAVTDAAGERAEAADLAVLANAMQ